MHWRPHKIPLGAIAACVFETPDFDCLNKISKASITTDTTGEHGDIIEIYTNIHGDYKVGTYHFELNLPNCNTRSLL